MFDVFERALALQDKAERLSKNLFRAHEHTRTIIPTALYSLHILSPSSTSISQNFINLFAACSNLAGQASMWSILEGTILSTRMDIHTAMVSPSVPSKGPLGSKMKFKAIQIQSRANSGTNLDCSYQNNFLLAPSSLTMAIGSLTLVQVAALLNAAGLQLTDFEIERLMLSMTRKLISN